MTMHQRSGRGLRELREINITPGYLKHPAGSALVEWGDNRIVCAASISKRLPGWLEGAGKGWVTAEYGMLPGSTNSRIQRPNKRLPGRHIEIQRVIGRALRSIIDLEMLGEHLIEIDCDVIQADGGTRTACITGGYVALALAVAQLREDDRLVGEPLRDTVSAVSVGIVDGQLHVDLDYDEDSRAEVDMNLVMTGTGQIVELQGGAEGAPFSTDALLAMIDAGTEAVQRIGELQMGALGDVLVV